jgi:hypothetical protein
MTAEALRRLADEAEWQDREETLRGVCEAVGIGVRELQSRSRTADTVKRREVVAWILVDRLDWSQVKAARALGRTFRQVGRMLRNQRVTSYCDRT